MDNVKRLAELGQKDEITAAERHEGVALAEAIFGTRAMETLDSVRIALRNKKISRESTARTAQTRLEQTRQPNLNSADAADVKNKKSNTVAVGPAGSEPEGSEPKSDGESESKPDTSAFKLDGDKYSFKEKGNQYLKNGGRIKKADWLDAKAEAEKQGE